MSKYSGKYKSEKRALVSIAGERPFKGETNLTKIEKIGSGFYKFHEVTADGAEVNGSGVKENNRLHFVAIQVGTGGLVPSASEHIYVEKKGKNKILVTKFDEAKGAVIKYKANKI